MTRRRARRGFTLAEAVIALAVTGLVALLAFGALQAGLDTEARVSAATSGSETATLFRDLLASALRHASAASSEGTQPFEITSDGPGGGGLRFVSGGVSGAPGSGALWDVRVSADSLGALLRAVPRDGGPIVVARVPGVRTLRVLAMARADRSTWVERWESRLLPIAARVELGDGVPALVVRIGLEDLP